MTVVYLDRVVLLNLAVDYLLLLATARLAGLPLRRGGWPWQRRWARCTQRRYFCPGAGCWRTRRAGWRRGSLCAVWPGGGNAVPGG